MQQANQLVTQVATNIKAGCSSTMQQEPSSTESFVNEILRELKGIFTGWRAAFPGRGEYDAYARQFTLAIAERGLIDEQQLRGGVKKARAEAAKGREFMPPGPLFAQWCIDEVNRSAGVPTEDEAFKIAAHWNQLAREQKHPAVLFALMQLEDRHKFFNGSRANQLETMKEMFKAAWKKTTEHILNRGELPKIPLELEEKKKPAASRAHNRAQVANLKSMMMEEE